jgi:hypothetical protein
MDRLPPSTTPAADLAAEVMLQAVAKMDPLSDPEQLREAVALGNGFRLARSYFETEAAKFIGVHAAH